MAAEDWRVGAVAVSASSMRACKERERLDLDRHSLYGGGVLRARGVLLLGALGMLTAACTLGAPGAANPSPSGLIGVEPTSKPPAADVPLGAEVLLFVTHRDLDYGIVDQTQYIKDFKSPAGVVDLDVRCVDPTGEPLTVRLSARPGDRQAELVTFCTIETGHEHGTYDLGPPYAGSRWIAEITTHRQTRFQVLITQPAPTPTRAAPR